MITKIKLSPKHHIFLSGHELASKEFSLNSDGNPAEKMTIISHRSRKIRSSSSFDIFASDSEGRKNKQMLTGKVSQTNRVPLISSKWKWAKKGWQSSNCFVWLVQFSNKLTKALFFPTFKSINLLIKLFKFSLEIWWEKISASI